MKILLLIFVLSSCINLKGQIVPFYSAINDKYGYENDKGEVVIVPKYDLAYALDEGMAAVRLNGKYGYIDKNGKEIVSPRYDNTWKFIGGFAAVKSDGKYGFIDKRGKEVIRPIYQDAYNYHGACCYKGMAHVKLNGKWKVIKIEHCK
jgi:hypothetical protein